MILTLYRRGDFYEAYGQDAEALAEALQITLTERLIPGQLTPVPMAGAPYHAIDRYVAALEIAGFDVELCEDGTGAVGPPKTPIPERGSP